MKALNKITSPVMRYHGAKFRLADWVMSLFPQHECYVEPFGGAAGVLMQKPRVYAEVYNDMDGEIVNVFRVLRDPVLCERLIELRALTPFARDEFALAYEPHADQIEQARRTLFRSQAGFGTGAASGNTSGFRCDAKRAYSLSSHIWARYPAQIAAFTERLQGVIIENRPAVDVIAKNDGEQTLFFVDPPYLMDTRNSHGGKVYRHEMTDEEHYQLLQVLLDVKGYVVITGYDHPLYREQLKDWELHTKSARISSGRGTSSRIEHAWLNPQCANAMNMPGLFGMGNLVNA